MSKSREAYEAVAAQVTARLVDMIEAGPGAWQQSWRSVGAGFHQTNAATGAPYRGGNVLITAIAAIDHGWTSTEWATYKQWQQLGAQVRKGEKATRLTYWSRFVPKSERAEARAEGREPRSIPMVNIFTVFNACQVVGFEPDHQADGLEPDERGEQLIAAHAPTITIGEPAYLPVADRITMPPLDRFDSPADYYATLFHEMTHWTGHKTRLDRLPKLIRFGDDAYGAEELVAELGAAMVAASVGIEPAPRPDHAAYLASWLRVMKADTTAIMTAAARAGDAAHYLTAPLTAAQTAEPAQV